MKTYITKQLSLVLLLGSILAFTACNKENDTQEAIDVESAEANALTDLEMSNVDEFVEAIIDAEPLLNGRVAAPDNFPSCATRTFNRDTNTVTLDFGTTNCLCRDGKLRRGKIVSKFEGRPHQEGSKVITMLVDYFVNDMRVTGIRTVTYVNHNKRNIVIRDASITTPEGKITWRAERVIERIAGGETQQISDDVYLIRGVVVGVNRRGIAFSTITEQPLKRVLAPGCARHFVSGIIVIKNENGHTLRLNYDPTGKEPCDDIAEVTLNGKVTRTIQLR
jgi:hypothetical protein